MSTLKAKVLVACLISGVLTTGLAAFPPLRKLPWILFPFLGGGILLGVGNWIVTRLRTRLEEIGTALDRSKDTSYETITDFKREDEFDVLHGPLVEVTTAVRTAHTDAERQQKEMRGLLELNGSLASTENPQQVYDRLLRGSLGQLDARGGAVYIVDERKPTDLIVQMVRGQIEHCRVGDRIAAGEGAAGQCAQNRKALVVRPTLPDRFAKRISPEVAERNVLCVPLMVRSELVGVLELADKEDEGGFTQTDGELLGALCSSAAVVIQNMDLNDELQLAFLQTVRALAHAVDAKDTYTQYHSNRVADYAVAMGRETGFPPTTLDALQFAASLHDIGKIAIREEILNKPGRLSDEEFEIMKGHAAKGAEILLPVDFPWDVLPVVRQHHERWDGRGYPDGLNGEGIHVHARMTAICDAFDAMTTNRPYRPGMPVEDAMQEISRCRGNQFDPELVHVFRAAFEHAGESIMKRYEALEAGQIHSPGDAGDDHPSV